MLEKDFYKFLRNDFYFFIASLTTWKKIYKKPVQRMYRLKLFLKAKGIKTADPNCTQKHIAKELGCSDSTIKIYRSDQIMDSPYS